MAKTWLEHSLGAIGIQVILAPLFNDWWLAGIAAVLFWLGREINQHEEKERRTNPDVKFLNQLHFGWGLIHGWHLDSVMDVAMPALACATLGVIFG